MCVCRCVCHHCVYVVWFKKFSTGFFFFFQLLLLLTTISRLQARIQVRVETHLDLDKALRCVRTFSHDGDMSAYPFDKPGLFTGQKCFVSGRIKNKEEEFKKNIFETISNTNNNTLSLIFIISHQRLLLFSIIKLLCPSHAVQLRAGDLFPLHGMQVSTPIYNKYTRTQDYFFV